MIFCVVQAISEANDRRPSPISASRDVAGELHLSRGHARAQRGGVPCGRWLSRHRDRPSRSRSGIPRAPARSRDPSLPDGLGQPGAVVVRAGVRDRPSPAAGAHDRRARAWRPRPAPQRATRHARAGGGGGQAGRTESRLRHARLRTGAVPGEVRLICAGRAFAARGPARRDSLCRSGDCHQRDPARARDVSGRPLRARRHGRAQRSARV